MGFPGSSASKESACNQETLVPFLGQEDPLEKGQATHCSVLGLPRCPDGRESTCKAGDLGSIPGLGRSPVRGPGNPLQYSYPENPMDRQAWQAAVPGVANSRTRLSD